MHYGIWLAQFFIRFHNYVDTQYSICGKTRGGLNRPPDKSSTVDIKLGISNKSFLAFHLDLYSGCKHLFEISVISLVVNH